jgi:hypothetical protein
LHIESRLQGDRDATLEKYLAIIGRMEHYIKRTKNTKADELAKATARKTTLPPDVFFQTIEDSSVKIVEPKPKMINITQGED